MSTRETVRGKRQRGSDRVQVTEGKRHRRRDIHETDRKRQKGTDRGKQMESKRQRVKMEGKKQRDETEGRDI
jgi:hypothetical protein